MLLGQKAHHALFPAWRCPVVIPGKERLEDIASFNQAVANNDEEGIEAHMRWCAAESDYDELSEHDPDEHEIMEMAMEADRVNNQMSDY